jgi:HAD superfamily hydrolase (TIGR01509 family)
MILDFPEGDFEGVIFDCDGTLVDSMPLHYRAWTASFVHHGAPWHWTEDEFYANAGVPDRVTVMSLNARYGVNLDPDSVHDFKAAWYSKGIHELGPVPAVAELARKYRADGIPVSVASGSELMLVAPSLEAAGLGGLFDIVITPADVARGKPAPDMFLLAAERMGVAPERCLVFEDGKPGVEAAVAAGMKWVFVPSRFG